MTPPPSYDVIIVGAGLSGLQAAATIQQSGLSCLILEATARIGGKVMSTPALATGTATVDLGPAWINDTSQSHMWALGQKHGIEFQVQRDEGDEIFEDGDGVVVRQPRGRLQGTDEDQRRTLEFLDLVDEVGIQIADENFLGPVSTALDQVTFDAWTRRQTSNLEPAVSFMNFMVRVLVGAEADEISALYILRLIESGTGFGNVAGTAKGSGQYLRPKSGCQAFVHGLASALSPTSIYTSCPVTSITQHETYCTVVTDNDTGPKTTHTALKVIISIPTPLYRHISFQPALPASKTRLSESTKLGYYTKVVAVYTSPWWRGAGLAGEATSYSDAGPITWVADTSVDSEAQYSLSLFIVGKPGRAWSKFETPERRRRVLSHLERLFEVAVGDGGVPAPVSLVEMEWAKERWFEGAPSSLYPVGVFTGEEGRSLRERFGLVHFVGTEMSDVWEGYMEGAVRDGDRGGREVVQAIREGGGL